MVRTLTICLAPRPHRRAARCDLAPAAALPRAPSVRPRGPYSALFKQSRMESRARPAARPACADAGRRERAIDTSPPLVVELLEVALYDLIELRHQRRVPGAARIPPTVLERLVPIACATGGRWW